MATWQTARVFISSTFRDMHAERDHLVKTVFPALRERLAKYRVHLVDIDLRWGVTQEQSDNDLALDLCLQQIEDCRPFFIGLLGERYGYVPKRFNQEALSRYGWVQHYTDKSITELEILHGVLRQPRMHDHAFFFFRDPAFKRDVPPPKRAEVEAEDAESAQNLERLKQNIRAARLPVPPVENYPCHYRGLRINRRLAAAALDEAERRTLEQIAPGGIIGAAEYDRLSGRLLEVVNKEGVVYLDGLEAFGQRVQDQLWQAIQTELKLPEKPPAEAAAATDPLAEEADYHERFMESRLRVYVGRESIQQQLFAYANSDETKPLLVTGPSGTGKSAVLARFVQSLSVGVQASACADEQAKAWTPTAAASSDSQSASAIPHSALIIPHFIGASPNSTSLRQMLRRFCLTLRKEFEAQFEREKAERLAAVTGQDENAAKQRQAIEQEYEVPQETNVLVSTLRKWLEKVPRDQRVVIVIDALNQLDETDNAQALHWLPWQLPPNVKMVVSCIEEETATVTTTECTKCTETKKGNSGPPSVHSVHSVVKQSVLDSFQHRPHIRLQVEPLTDAERLEIVRAVPSLSAKTLDDAQIALLLANPATRNPLFLLVALEELRGFGSFEHLNDRIRAFPREGDTLSAIFQQVIERLEEEFDSTLVRRLLSLLACARIGLSEQELEELVTGDWRLVTRNQKTESSQSSSQDSNAPSLHHSAPSADLFPVLRQLRPYLQYRGLLVDFYHRNLFKAVHERYLGEAPRNADTHVCDASVPGPTALQNFHSELAGYFRSKADPVGNDSWTGRHMRSWSELAFHMFHADEGAELRILLMTYLWIRGRLRMTDVVALISDYDLLKLERNEPLGLIQGALQLSAHVLLHDRSQLVSHLTARLLDLQQPEMEQFLRRVRQDEREPWLRPLTGSLTAPGGPLLRTLEGHSDGIAAVAATPDGRRALSASEDKTLKVWDLESGACLRTLEGHSKAVTAVAVTPDGWRAVSGGSDDCTVKVWNLESGACLRTMEGHGVGGVDDVLRSEVRAVAVTPDGRRVISGATDCHLKVWDLESGTCLRTLKGHSDEVQTVAVTPDGRRVVSGSGDMTLKVWDLETGVCLQTVNGHNDWVGSVVLMPDGRQAVSGAGNDLPSVSGANIKVWDLESGACLRTLEGHGGHVLAVAVTPDGRQVVSAGGYHEKALKVWDLKSGACLRTMEGHGNGISTVAVTPDGQLAVSGSGWDKTLEVWDLNAIACPRTLKGHGEAVLAIAVTPDGRRAVSGSGDKTLKLWDLSSGVCLRTLEGHSDGIAAVAATPDGRRALSASEDKTLKVWDLESGACLRTLEGHSKAVTAVAVTADGRRVVSGSEDGTLKVWDLETGACLRTVKRHNDWVGAVAVMPDGQRAFSGARNWILKEWDLESCKCRRALEGGNPWVPEVVGAVNVVVVTPDGRRAVLSGGELVRVWDLDSDECLRTLKEHGGRVKAVAVTPDGRRAVSASEDTTLKVWDLESGETVATFNGEAGIEACAVGPDGEIIVAGDSLGRVHFLRLEEASGKR